MNITLKVVVNALKPTNGVLRCEPPPAEPRLSGTDVPDASDQSRLLIDAGRTIPPLPHLRHSVFLLLQSNVQLGE